MSSLKESYTTSEWKAREDFYVDVIQQMIIPTDPTTKDIIRLESQIDEILSQALLDQSYIRRRFDKANQDMKLATTEQHYPVKSDPTYANSKLTTDDIKSIVIAQLKSTPLPGYPSDIYTIVNALNYRLTFISETIRVLTEKKSSMMIISSMMKIEAGM